jgi:hypothetical protein
MNFDKKTLTQLGSKYLDRIELKGLNEFHEFSYLLNFFAELEQDKIKIELNLPTEGE